VLPGTGRAAVAVPAPGAGEGNWTGAPSALRTELVAVRRPAGSAR
jgi:hypothetical protein